MKKYSHTLIVIILLCISLLLIIGCDDKKNSSDTIPDTSPPATTPPSTPGQGFLVAYYPFNGNANDESGNGYHGTVTGATLATDRNGNSNSAYYFNGSSYITVEADDSVLNVDTTGWTLSFWVKADDGQDVYATPMISHGRGNSGGYSVDFWEQYGMYNTTFYDYAWSGANVAQDELDDFIWYMYTITYDGVTIKVYVDGVLVDQATGTYYPTTPEGTYALIFGSESRHSSFFKGYLDDIRIYNTALTDVEVAHLSELSGAIRATELNAYSLADFEQGILKPAKFSNFWAVWGNHGNAYTEVVENPLKSGYNTSNYVGVSHTFPSLPLPDTSDCDKSEYVLTSADGLVTDQHHILKWKLLFTDSSILNIEDIVWDWMSFNQIHTGASKYPPPGVAGDPDDTIAYGGGIFNDLKKANSTDSSVYNFRFRAIPDEALVPFHINIGQWMSFTYEIFWTQSNAGYWRVWKDGELLTSADNVKTLPDSYDPEEDDFIQFKTGLYNKWNDTDIERLSLYFDDIELYIGDDISVQDVSPECINPN